MGSLLALPAVVVLAVTLGACGDARMGTGPAPRVSSGAAKARGASTPASSSSIPALRYLGGDYDPDDYDSHRYDADNDDRPRPRDRDNDSDNSSNSYYDSDDNSVRALGRAASAADRQAVTALVKRYFAAAAAEDGRAACSMLVASIARSLPEDLGKPPGPPDLRGTTCAGIASKVFKQNRRQLRIYAATLEVTGVRLTHEGGLAVLGLKTLPGRTIRVARESGVWKIDTLLDAELP